MSQAHASNRRSPTPGDTAHSLYRGVFAVQTQADHALAAQTWRELEPADQSFIACHLQYLTLMAQSRNEHLLNGILECLEDLTGATIAIADVVTLENRDTDNREPLDPEALAAEWREVEHRYGVQLDSSPAPEMKPSESRSADGERSQAEETSAEGSFEAAINLALEALQPVQQEENAHVE